MEATDRAKRWAQANPWFGKNPAATEVAVNIHVKLLDQGVAVESDDYYNKLYYLLKLAKQLGLLDARVKIRTTR